MTALICRDGTDYDHIDSEKGDDDHDRDNDDDEKDQRTGTNRKPAEHYRKKRHCRQGQQHVALRTCVYHPSKSPAETAELVLTSSCRVVTHNLFVSLTPFRLPLLGFSRLVCIPKRKRGFGRVCRDLSGLCGSLFFQIMHLKF